MIEVKNLNKSYKKHHAISDLNFNISAGELIGFIGPNGAGKTTTIKCLSSLMVPDSGQISINNKNILLRPESVRNIIGFLPETIPLIDELTVKDFLKYRYILKADKQKSVNSVEKCLDICDLNSVENKIIGKLSKGFKQRIGIAETLLHRPEILLLDEPINGLDPEQIIKIRDLLISLKGTLTIIISSHILSELELICDKYLIISGGKLKIFGTQEEIINQSSYPFKTEIEFLECDPDIINELKKITDIFDLKQTKNIITYKQKKINKQISIQVSKILKNSKAQLLKLNHIKPGLEDLYMELTNG